MQKISVMTSSGSSVLVSVWYVKEGKGLAVQKMWDYSDKYAVVHMWSRKLVLSPLPNRQAAKYAMEALLKTSINWELSASELETLVKKGNAAYDEYVKVRDSWLYS
jgi:hypothetical protein